MAPNLSKVEEVARAMFEKRPQNRAGVKWEDTHPHTRKVWRQTALIAIEAMREPTPEMLRGVPDWDRAVWLTMFDIALAEHQSTPGAA